MPGQSAGSRRGGDLPAPRRTGPGGAAGPARRALLRRIPGGLDGHLRRQAPDGRPPAVPRGSASVTGSTTSTGAAGRRAAAATRCWKPSCDPRPSQRLTTGAAGSIWRAFPGYGTIRWMGRRCCLPACCWTRPGPRRRRCSGTARPSSRTSSSPPRPSFPARPARPPCRSSPSPRRPAGARSASSPGAASSPGTMTGPRWPRADSGPRRVPARPGRGRCGGRHPGGRTRPLPSPGRPRGALRQPQRIRPAVRPGLPGHRERLARRGRGRRAASRPGRARRRHRLVPDSSGAARQQPAGARGRPPARRCRAARDVPAGVGRPLHRARIRRARRRTLGARRAQPGRRRRTRAQRDGAAVRRGRRPRGRGRRDNAAAPRSGGNADPVARALLQIGWREAGDVPAGPAGPGDVPAGPAGPGDARPARQARGTPRQARRTGGGCCTPTRAASATTCVPCCWPEAATASRRAQARTTGG